MLTILTLIEYNCPEIRDFFESIVHLGLPVTVVSIGHAPETLKICEEYKANILHYGFETDRSKALNIAIDQGAKGYYLYMNPWETLFSINLEKLNERIYNASVVTNGILIKEPRILNKEAGVRFKNPVCQIINEKTDKFCSCIILSKSELNLENKLDLIIKWHSTDPNNYDIFYYRAACLLAMGRHDEFLVASERYMRLNKKIAIASTMNKYYYAMVKGLVKKDTKPAIQNLVQCLVANPLMAEFWCLIGDLHYANKKYDLAYEFYENGYLLGASRKKDDKWPIDVSKYEEYPLKMMESCKGLISSRIFFKKTGI